MALAGLVWLLQSPSDNNTNRSKKRPDFEPLRDYCAKVPAIQPREYVERQQRLAEVLSRENASALIMEPGPAMKYFTNIAWDLSERPFLVVLQLDQDAMTTGIRTTVVTPMFEATRAYEAIKEAKLPKDIPVHVVEWIEHGSPYTVVAERVLKKQGIVFLEPNVRLFVADGLVKALEQQQVRMSSRALQTLRMVKSRAEVEILRCANHVTELAIRKVRAYVEVGMTEADIAQLMESALATAGLTNIWVLALIDENAAFPHGEPGQRKRVGPNSSVLIDTGGELLGKKKPKHNVFFLE